MYHLTLLGVEVCDQGVSKVVGSGAVRKDLFQACLLVPGGLLEISGVPWVAEASP